MYCGLSQFFESDVSNLRLLEGGGFARVFFTTSAYILAKFEGVITHPPPAHSANFDEKVYKPQS